MVVGSSCPSPSHAAPAVLGLQQRPVFQVGLARSGHPHSSASTSFWVFRSTTLHSTLQETVGFLESVIREEEKAARWDPRNSTNASHAEAGTSRLCPGSEASCPSRHLAAPGPGTSACRTEGSSSTLAIFPFSAGGPPSLGQTPRLDHARLRQTTGGIATDGERRRGSFSGRPPSLPHCSSRRPAGPYPAPEKPEAHPTLRPGPTGRAVSHRLGQDGRHRHPDP